MGNVSSIIVCQLSFSNSFVDVYFFLTSPRNPQFLTAYAPRSFPSSLFLVCFLAEKKKQKKKRKQSVVVVGLCCCSALGNIFFSTGSVRLFVRPSVCLSMCPNQVVWRSGPVMQCRGSVVPLIWWRRGITAWHSRPLHSLPFLSLKNNEKTNAANLSCSSLLCLCNPNQRNCQIVLQSGVLYLSLSSPNPCQSVPTLSSSTSSRSSSFSCVCLSPVLFFNLYLYFIFTKIYTNRLRIVINFN